MSKNTEKSENAQRDRDKVVEHSVPQDNCVSRTDRIFAPFLIGSGKTFFQLRKLIPPRLERDGEVLVCRVDMTTGEKLCSTFPEGIYDPLARVFMIRKETILPAGGDVVIVSAADTGDLGVALEAKYTLDFRGIGSEIITDAGVGTFEELSALRERLSRADVCIAVSGMDGTLPGVIGKMVNIPVIAVPASIGGIPAFQGLAALLSMLNSCADGVTVVNIDNGLGAACAAARMIQKAKS